MLIFHFTPTEFLDFIRIKGSTNIALLTEFMICPDFYKMTISKLHPAIFLDRDGTLIEEVGYIDTPGKIKMIPDADAAIRLLKEIGYQTIIVSNQSGVARGYFDESTVQSINRRVLDLFAAEEARIDAVYYCPHHPKADDQNYGRDCECRKPKPGMFLKAAEEHNIDLSKSIMIGDKHTDVQAGKNLRMFSILLLTGFGKGELEKMKKEGMENVPDLIAENVYEAALYIKDNLGID